MVSQRNPTIHFSFYITLVGNGVNNDNCASNKPRNDLLLHN